MDPTVIDFAGGVLPDGWVAQAPTGATVDLAGDYLQLAIEPGHTFNSLSGTIHAPQGPLVWRPVDGQFDLAVALAEEATNLPNSGLDLLALTDAMNGVRFCAYSGTQTSTFRNDIAWYVRDHPVNHTVLNTTGDQMMSGLYGGPGWLRMAWDGSTFRCYASHTGRSGDWHTIAEFASSLIPSRFAMHAIAFPSGADGRVQRIRRVVDLAARGNDDATSPPPPDLVRQTIHVTDFRSGAVPSWLEPAADNGGAVAADESGAVLSIHQGTLRSQAWLLGPDNLPKEHGMLLRYQLVGSGYTNAFWVPAVAVDTTTDVPGARTPDDKWGRGTSLIMEMPGRAAAGEGELVRVLRRSPIAAGAEQSGNREFDGYTLMVEDRSAPVSTVGNPVSWLRLERAGARLRARLWADGAPEPDEWHYQAEDWMRWGRGAAITLSQNDGVSGTGTAAVRLSHVELYALLVESGPDPTPDITPGILTVGGISPTLTAGGIP